MSALVTLRLVFLAALGAVCAVLAYRACKDPGKDA
jgi:hypothetical protein